MVENKYKINDIEIEMRARCFCPLGQDWYTNQFEIEFQPDETIPDYCELDAFLKNNIDGKEYIIEEAVSVLFEHLEQQYKPVFLCVKSRVTDAAHSAVTVQRYGVLPY